MRNIYFFMALMLLTLAGCKTAYLPVVGTDTVTVTNTVVRDSIVELPADSSFIRAFFECDSLNRVIMTELEIQAGDRVSQKTVFKNEVLFVTAEVDSQAIYLSWKERYDTSKVTNTIYQPVPVEKIVYKVPTWAKGLSGLAIAAIVFLIIRIIKKLTK